MAISQIDKDYAYLIGQFFLQKGDHVAASDEIVRIGFTKLTVSVLDAEAGATQVTIEVKRPAFLIGLKGKVLHNLKNFLNVESLEVREAPDAIERYIIPPDLRNVMEDEFEAALGAAHPQHKESTMSTSINSVLETDALMSFDGKRSLIAAGPLFRQPGTMPYRIVIYQDGDSKVVVSNEQVPNWPNSIGANFSSGDYFGLDKLPDAFETFAKRVSRQAEYAESMYRLLAADDVC